MNTITRIFWSESFWLPENVTWEDVRVYTKNYQPLVAVWDCLYAAFFLSVLRFSISSFFVHLGLSFGIKKPIHKTIPHIRVLENAFLKTRHPDEELLENLKSTLKMDKKSIEIWFKNKRNQTRYPVVVKFSESGWKFCFYTTMFFYGVCALHDKEYVYDIEKTIIGYPAFQITREIYWYYMIELGYYVAEMGWIFYGVRRTDFRVLLLHHVATVGLMLFSYVTNHHRIGAVILVIHDIADCWMESAKMFKYVKKHRVAEILFGIFMFVWVITRLTYFPFWVLHTVLTTGFNLYGLHPVYFIFVGLLSTLQVMHIFWFYLIFKIALQVKTDSKKAKDCRSDSESSEEYVDSHCTTTEKSVAQKLANSTVKYTPEANGTLSHSNEVVGHWLKQRNVANAAHLHAQVNGK